MDRPIHRVLDRIDPGCQQILNSTVEAARARLLDRAQLLGHAAVSLRPFLPRLRGER